MLNGKELKNEVIGILKKYRYLEEKDGYFIHQLRRSKSQRDLFWRITKSCTLGAAFIFSKLWWTW